MKVLNISFEDSEVHFHDARNNNNGSKKGMSTIPANVNLNIPGISFGNSVVNNVRFINSTVHLHSKNDSLDIHAGPYQKSSTSASGIKNAQYRQTGGGKTSSRVSTKRSTKFAVKPSTSKTGSIKTEDFNPFVFGATSVSEVIKVEPMEPAYLQQSMKQQLRASRGDFKRVATDFKRAATDFKQFSQDLKHVKKELKELQEIFGSWN